MDVTAEPVLERRRRLTQVISQTCPKALAPDKNTELASVPRIEPPPIWRPPVRNL
jgi:hypothetical protein